MAEGDVGVPLRVVVDPEAAEKVAARAAARARAAAEAAHAGPAHVVGLRREGFPGVSLACHATAGSSPCAEMAANVLLRSAGGCEPEKDEGRDEGAGHRRARGPT